MDVSIYSKTLGIVEVVQNQVRVNDGDMVHLIRRLIGTEAVPATKMHFTL